MTEEKIKQKTKTASASQAASSSKYSKPSQSSKTPQTPATKKPSESAPESHKTSLNAILITFTVVILAIFFGAQLIEKTGIFYQQRQLIFANSASELNRDFITSNLNIDQLNLIDDLTIGATSTTELSENENHLLYDILVPVADFYSSEIDINESEQAANNLISIWDLTPAQRLLSLDNHYYLGTFTTGAFFQYFTFEGNAQDIARIKQLLSEHIATFPSSDAVLTLAQTGVTALSRHMYDKLLEVNNDATYFTQNIGAFLSDFDLTHTSNEASFSTNANGSNICAAPAMLDVITSSGLDIIELTGNHNLDCGDQAAIDTIAQYDKLNIQTFGGGIDSASAAIPLEIDAKDTHITLLGYNFSTGGYTLDDTPGANFYTETKARDDITTAKAHGDFVIVDVQYYECSEYVNTTEDITCDYANSSEGNQIALFRHLIDLGADIVVGTAAHQPQTYEQYHDGEIYYGLGNLFFDQDKWPGTTRSIILVHYFWQGQLIQTRLIPTVYDSDYQTSLMSLDTARAFLKRLTAARPKG